MALNQRLCGTCQERYALDGSAYCLECLGKVPGMQVNSALATGVTYRFTVTIDVDRDVLENLGISDPTTVGGCDRFKRLVGDSLNDDGLYTLDIDIRSTEVHDPAEDAKANLKSIIAELEQ